MELIKAVHDCKEFSEKKLVTGIKNGRFEFLRRWGFLAWIMNGTLIIATAGVWIGFIIGWYLLAILNPQYSCQECGKIIKRKQYRLLD